MNQSKHLVFFGNERLASGLRSTSTPLLSGLIARGYTIVAIVAHHDNATSRSARKLEVADIAHKHNIPLLLPEKPVDIINQLREYSVDAAVLSAYGRIIPQSIIDLFEPFGIINLHPSLLPCHRGPTPIESTILCNDRTAGVSVMKLAAGMDDGPLYGQYSVPLRGDENKFELYKNLSHHGSTFLLDLLPGILTGKVIAKDQKNSDVSITPLISKQDGHIDLSTDTAVMVERKVRAYLGYPKTRISISDNDVIVTSAVVADSSSDGALVVKCANNTYIELREVIAPSGKTMSGAAYLHGYSA